MKRLFLSMFLIFTALSIFAQVKFDLGLKGGINCSKISFDVDDYSSELVTKTHFGAFARIGLNRIFIQPEFYFSGKGGDATSNVFSTLTSFDYKTMDIPVLLGFRLIQKKAFDLHIVAGPVFSNITSEDVTGSNLTNQSYKDNYVGIQYGLGFDILFLTFDARMENGLGTFYTQPEVSGKNQMIMLSVGFKIL